MKMKKIDEKINWNMLPLSMKIPMIWFWIVFIVNMSVLLAVIIIAVFNIPI